MLVIIGSGLAGYMLAKEVRKIDKEISITIVTTSRGDFYSKPLLSTALTNNKTAADLAINSVESMAEQLNVNILPGTRVESIDRKNQSISANDVVISYSQLVLACGSSPITPPLQGDALQEMLSVNDLEAYGDFRAWLTEDKQHIAMLGSGLVGCEFSNDLLNSGRQVEIISLDAYPLAKFVPEKIGRILESAFSAKGVTWHLQQPVQSVDHFKDSYQVTLENGLKIKADGVFSAIGLRANTKLAQSAGLTVNQGIVVDQYLQTNDPQIFALGDCAEVLGEVKQYVAPLLHCARALAKVLTGSRDPLEYACMPVVIKTPTCPIAACPIKSGTIGEWRYEGEGQNMSALFYDTNNQLRGFALTGDKTRNKFNLAKDVN